MYAAGHKYYRNISIIIDIHKNIEEDIYSMEILLIPGIIKLSSD